jgi:hypothetical protein
MENTRLNALEKRVDQLEKDVQEITVILSKLLTWKRNQTMRTIPEAHAEEKK